MVYLIYLTPNARKNMRFFIVGMSLFILSGCCGNVDPNGLPCYRELFSKTKEEQQKEEYALEKKRSPRFNR